MVKKLLAVCVFLVFLLNFCSAYVLNESREEMLSYYQTYLEPKIPRTAKALLGDERINVQIGGKTLGIATKRGELSDFEVHAIGNPTIEVAVSDAAAEAIKGKKVGIMPCLDDGSIKVRTSNFFTAVKVEMMKRIYAVSGADDAITGKAAPSRSIESYNSIYIQRAKITN
ncbi:MAG: hypothetical protein WCT52_01605 [Candidatus Micrarchaeia archaeon]